MAQIRPLRGLLRLSKPTFCSVRLCSSYEASNLNFPSFTTVGKNYSDFSNFTKSPNIQVIASIILHGKTNQNIKSIGELDTEEFLEGCLFAIDSVTRAFAEEDVEESLKTLGLTETCHQKLVGLIAQDPRFMSPSTREQVCTPRDDIVFSWIERYKGSNARICTLSFPAANFIREKIVESDQKMAEFQKQIKSDIQAKMLSREEMKEAILNFNRNRFDPHQHIKKNELICSNWDFILDSSSQAWLLDGFAMRKLSETTNQLMSFRWNGRFLISISRNAKFINVLRIDYGSDYFFLLIFLNLFIASALLGQDGLAQGQDGEVK